jgi:glycosyltransferase involved in cell wall biosynthesis
MIAHSYYDEDPRVRREAEAVARSGREVDVFALRPPDAEKSAVVDGVRVHRLDVRRHQGAGAGTYVLEYLDFFTRAAFAVSAAHARRRYGLAQVHSLPDFLAFACLPLRSVGVPLLLDLHEAMPVFYRDRFPSSPRILDAVLRAQERASIGVASSVITVNELLRARLIARGVDPRKVAVIRNTPQLARFDPGRVPSRRFAEDGIVRLVYTGALSRTYELPVAIEATAVLREARPELPVRFEIYGRDFGELGLPEQIHRLGLDEVVALHGRIPIEDVPAAVAAADIGLATTARTPFTELSLSTKILEYGAMRKPVVASALPSVLAAYAGGEVVTYEPADPAALAEAILRVVDDEAGRDRQVEAMARLVEDQSWEREEERYLAIVDRLARR